MPELPEVETITRQTRTLINGKALDYVRVFRTDLRAPLPTAMVRKILKGQTIQRVFRRSKYLLLETDLGYCIFHFGMTGKFVFRSTEEPEEKHTHLVLGIKSDSSFLHFVDPRRFGSVTATRRRDWTQLSTMKTLGPEPLEHEDLGTHLWQTARNRSAPVKNFLMDSRTVVGVGNIYACEALFRAGISPLTPAGRISRQRYQRLGQAVQDTLSAAIQAGGTTFRDFRNVGGEDGYFKIHLTVYGREGQRCLKCSRSILVVRLAGRNSWYCPSCQK